MDKSDLVTLIVTLAISGGIGFVLYKLNGAIKLLNARVNILSHSVSALVRESRARNAAPDLDDQAAREAELRRRIERDFR